MNRSTTQTPPMMARAMVETLLGDAEWTTPSGIPAYTYFALLDLEAAHEAYEQIYELPEGMRMRDLVERLGEDAAANDRSTRQHKKAIEGSDTPKNVETIETVACPKCGEVYPLREAETRTEAAR